MQCGRDQVLLKYEGPSPKDCMTSVTLIENMNILVFLVWPFGLVAIEELQGALKTLLECSRMFEND